MSAFESQPGNSSYGQLRWLLEEQRSEHEQQLRDLQVDASEGGLDAVVVARHKVLLRVMADIAQAVERLDAGTYGACVQCGSTIPPERLQWVPFADRCVTCAARLAASQ